ncbi:hypothetical protein G9A89_023672 [Geosiphon pyriformis]|nr:hypothetical protein G9A89_023672 [Geosiphon pyriformis]
MDAWSGLTSYFAASAFVDNTIWVGNCLSTTQKILDIVSEFFSVNDISINASKTVAILINQGVKDVSLSISGSNILVAKRKESHWLQFSCVLKSVCDSDALHHPELFGLRTFDQVLTENLLASLISFANAGGILGRLFDHRLNAQAPSPVFDQTADRFNELLSAGGGVIVLDKRLDPRDLVSAWFTLVNFVSAGGLLGGGFVPFCLTSAGVSCDFSYVHTQLLASGLDPVTIYTDGSVKCMGSVSACGGVAAYFPGVNASIGVSVNGLLSLILVELQAIALALECVPGSSLVVLFTDSQVSLDMCCFRFGGFGPDFWNKCWIEKEYISQIISKKSLSVTWNKVKGHSGDVGNECANFYTNSAVISSFILTPVVPFYFLRVEGRPVSGNAHQFVKALFNAVNFVGWEARYVGVFVDAIPYDDFDRARTFSVWHSDGKIGSGFTSSTSALLHSYFIKALHCHLLVAARKRLYNSKYPSVACIRCGLLENSDHTFSCLSDNNARKELLSAAALDWADLLGVCADGGVVFCFLGMAGVSTELYIALAKEVAVIAATIVKIHREIEQYANKNFPISTGNTRERTNKTKENLETNQESNQQKLGTPAQTPKKTIQIPLGAASSSTSTPQTPRIPRDIPITGGYSSLFQNPLFQPKFRTGFENREEESESESEKETSEKTITRPEEPDIKEATFRNAQGNIIPPPLRPINPLAENGNEMTTPYIARLTDFSGEEEETDVHTWLKEAQKAIQANNWNDQRAIQTLPFFLKGTADSWYQSLETKPMSFAEFKNALLEYFSNPNAVIQLQNEFNTIKQNTSETPMWNQNVLVQRNPNRARTNQQTNPNYQNYQQTYLNIPENLIIGNNDSRNINRTKNSSKLSQTIPPAPHSYFPFELEENETMFSGAALDKKCPITAMYTEATVNNIPIKLILDINQLGFKVDRAATSQIITADGSTKLPYDEIDSFPFEINGIVIPTKVLVMDTTQYQALVGNDWLTKANATLDWTTQELLINYNGHQAKIPAICGHFQKPSANQRPTFEFEENPALPAIETYQLSWADDQRTGLPAVPTWTSEERSEWNQLECSVCKKKLSSMTACSTPDKDPRNPTHYYCNHCNKEKYGYPERHGKWDKEPCLTCGELLPRGCDWNDLPDRGGTCDATCQYTILICDWVRGGTLFEAAFNRALKRLQHYPHDEDELYNTAQAKVRGGTAEEIRRWKESAEVANEVTSYNMFDPVDEFQDYYQQLCPTRQEQEQYLAQINTYLCENCLIPCQNERDLEKKMEIENQQSQNQSINQQDSPDGPESEKFVAYTDLEQVTDIRYFDNEHLGIIPERAHPTDAGFDLCYSEDQSTTLPPRSITKIDLKLAVEIPPGIMVQMASRSSLAKKGISVQGRFIRGLKSSILGRVRPAHPNSLPEAVTLARALESAEKEANHSQMVNMVMEENKTETLEKRVTRLGEELSKKIESYLIPDPRKNTYQPPQRRSQEVSDSRNNRPSHQEFRTETRACHFCKRVGHLISQCRTQMMQKARENNYYAPPQMLRNQYTPIPCQYPTTYQNQRAYQQQPMIANPNWHPEARNQPMWNQNVLVQRNPNRARTNQQTNPNYQNYQQTYLNIPENLIIGNNDSRNINRTKNSSKLSQTIPPAPHSYFPFELEENETMFSGAALDKKCPITAILIAIKAGYQQLNITRKPFRNNVCYWLGANSDDGVFVVKFKHDFLPRDGSLIPSVSSLSFLWSSDVICGFGIKLGIHVSFGLYLCLSSLDFGFLNGVLVIGCVGV